MTLDSASSNSYTKTIDTVIARFQDIDTSGKKGKDDRLSQEELKKAMNDDASLSCIAEVLESFEAFKDRKKDSKNGNGISMEDLVAARKSREMIAPFFEATANGETLFDFVETLRKSKDDDTLSARDLNEYLKRYDSRIGSGAGEGGMFTERNRLAVRNLVSAWDSQEVSELRGFHKVKKGGGAVAAAAGQSAQANPSAGAVGAANFSGREGQEVNEYITRDSLLKATGFARKDQLNIKILG